MSTSGSLRFLPLDLNQLLPEDREFVLELHRRFPAFEGETRMYLDTFVPSEPGWFPRLELETPGDDRELTLRVWTENHGEPSVGFGAWHSHWEFGDDSIFSTISRVLEGELVCVSFISQGRVISADLREANEEFEGRSVEEAGADHVVM